MIQSLNLIHKYIPSKDSSNHYTLLLLHGTGGNENSLIPISEIILPGAAVISLRGNTIENGMPRFFRRISEGVFDLEDLKVRTKELAKFIEDSSMKYGINSNNVVAVGYSNGANIALSVILSHPGLISKAVLYHPMIPFVPASSPDLSGTNILITAGTNDPIVDSEETNNLYAMLKSYGANIEIYWHDIGHNLTREEISRTKEFLK
jgi:phospholipase/carboxylesterase